LKKLPLQSPGVCAYLAVQGRGFPPYLRFKLGRENEKCRLLIQPAIVDEQTGKDGWFPARLLSPLDYTIAQQAGASGQRDYLDRLLAEEWWRNGFSEVRVLAKRCPAQ